MPIRNSRPIPFIPAGLSDTLDGTNSPPGAMAALQNLILDHTTPGLYACRPAATSATTFAGFTTPTTVTAMMALGTKIYGMVSTSRFAGHDEPFCYDTATGTFTTITGVTSANTPTTPVSTGAWTPPTMDMIGAYIIVTHPGFSGAVGVFYGVIDLTTPSAPTWYADNTNTQPLPSVPTAVKQFGNRAYFACGNNVWYTDVLNPLKITNSTNFLTCGGNDNIIALGVQAYTTTTQGILAGLLAFKSTQIWQVTGDLALGNLLLNSLTDNFGTLSPRSVTVTTLGTTFLCQDGIRTVLHDGSLTEPLGSPGEFSYVFRNVVTPSRAVACYANDIYRVCVQTTGYGATAYADFWYDMSVQVWTGPHTFIYECAVTVQNISYVAGPNVPGNIWKSNVKPGIGDVFIENGTQLYYEYQTSTFPDQPSIMCEYYLAEMTASMCLAGMAGSMSFAFLDASYSPIASYSISPIVGLPNGVFKYGIYFPTPVVFQRGAMAITGQSSTNVRLGDLFMRIQPQGYTNADLAPYVISPVTNIDYGLIINAATVSLDYGTLTGIVTTYQDFGYL